MEKQGVQPDRGADVVPIDSTVPAPPAAPAATPSMPSPTGFSNHAIHLVRTSVQMNLALSQMAEQDWADAVVDDLRADETVFRAMLHDVYQNGQVLQGKKYKYLGRAYRVFILGLTLTLVTFVVEYAAQA
jgi:hypothetical protein